MTRKLLKQFFQDSKINAVAYENIPEKCVKSQIDMNCFADDNISV